MENKFRFYNTLTREIETVIPNEEGKIAMYTCGPTVYHFAHIGNLRSYIMEDILERSPVEIKMSNKQLTRGSTDGKIIKISSWIPDER